MGRHNLLGSAAVGVRCGWIVAHKTQCLVFCFALEFSEKI